MKRSVKTDKQVEAPQKPAPESASSQEITVKTREQQVDELKVLTCKATGTRSYEVASRIVTQVSNGHVGPQPNDKFGRVVAACASMAEMAPKTFTEAMLAAQMLAANEAARLIAVVVFPTPPFWFVIAMTLPTVFDGSTDVARLKEGPCETSAKRRKRGEIVPRGTLVAS